MLSFRDIATSADNDADSLQTSLRELQRRRQVKQQKQQRERDAVFAEDENGDSAFTPVQELAYSREVLFVWSRSYPKLRDAIAALALASHRGSAQQLTATDTFTTRDSSLIRAGDAFHMDVIRSSSLDTLLASSSTNTSTGFSVADTIKRTYPPLWVIPAGTVPASYYSNTAAMDVSLQLSSASALHSNENSHNTNAMHTSSTQLHQLHPGRLGAAAAAAGGGASHSTWVTNYSQRRCLVRIWREALQLPISTAVASAAASMTSISSTPATSALGSWTPPPSVTLASLSNIHPTLQEQQLYQKQRVLARWPQGKPASTKVSAVLRSINIENRKREQWNEHVRQQQQQRQQNHDNNNNNKCDDGVTTNNHDSSEDSRCETVSQVSMTSYSVVKTAFLAGDKGNHNENYTESRRGSLPGMSEDTCGRELYWPAYITNTRAVFTGAACLQDDYHGLGLLQLYERFDTVLALALASPLRLVVDVVYSIDETSEGFGLSIDPVMKGVSGSTTATVKYGGVDTGTTEDEDTPGDASAYRSLFPQTSPRSPMGVSADATPTTKNAVTNEGTDANCPLLLPSTLPPVISDLNYSFQPVPTQGNTNTNCAAVSATAAAAANAAVDVSEDALSTATFAAAATLRRSTLSTAPLSAYAILAGPVSQSHSIVLLRPTPEVVCTARAQALQELELRWQRLRQALIDRLVAYEEEPPRSASSSEQKGENEESRSVHEEEAEEEKTGVSLVQLPDADSYVSPFIDRSAAPDEGLPEEPAGATTLTEEEMRRQTHLPELQGSSRKLRRPSWPPPAASARAHEQSLVPTRNVEKPAAVGAAATRSTSPTAPFQPSRLPARRRSLHNSPSSNAAADNSDRTTTVAVRSQHQRQPYTPRLVAFALQAAAKRATALFSDESSSVDYLAKHSSVRYHDEVCAYTQLPRSPADPLPTKIDLSSSANGVNTSELSVEESRVLSAAVRAAAARQKALEDAICSQQKPSAAPRHVLPSLTVEAPSPAFPETSASLSPSRKNTRQEQQKQQQLVTSVDITNNTSASFPSPILASTPPSSALSAALQETTKDFFPFSWDTVDATGPRDGKAPKNNTSNILQKANRGGLRSYGNSPSRVGGIGANDSSPLQFTPPAAHLSPRQRFNERGELIIPSLSVIGTSPIANRSTEAVAVVGATAASALHDVALSPIPAKTSTVVESPAASFSTPPPPAPPSHSSSPPQQAQHQPLHYHVSFLTKISEPPTAAVSKTAVAETASVSYNAPMETAVQRCSFLARQLLTPSYLHSDTNSMDDGSQDVAATLRLMDTASNLGHRSDTQPVAEKFSRTSPTYFPAALGGASSGKAPLTVTVGERAATEEQQSLASSLNTATSTISGSDIPQLSTTTTPASTTTVVPHQEKKIQHILTLNPSKAETASEAATSVHSTARPQTQGLAAKSTMVTVNDRREAATTATNGSARRASTELSTSPVTLFCPSFSSAPSSTGPSSNSSPQGDEHHLEVKHLQQQQQTTLDLAWIVPKKGILQSPRSLAASAAAAALAKSMAEAAAQPAAAAEGVLYPLSSVSRMGVLDLEEDLWYEHRSAEQTAKDLSTPYNRRFSVVDVLDSFDKKPMDAEVQQDSPLPRRPSLSKDAPVPELAKAPVAAPAHTTFKSHLTSLRTDGSESTQTLLFARQYQHHNDNYQPQTNEDVSTSGNSTASSSSVNREVELPNASSRRKTNSPRGTDANHQQQRWLQSPPALAVLHQQPHSRAPLHNIRALDDAELVRLYELLYRRNNSGPTVTTTSPDADIEGNEPKKDKNGSHLSRPDSLEGEADKDQQYRLHQLPIQTAVIPPKNLGEATATTSVKSKITEVHHIQRTSPHEAEDSVAGTVTCKQQRKQQSVQSVSLRTQSSNCYEYRDQKEHHRDAIQPCVKQLPRRTYGVRQQQQQKPQRQSSEIVGASPIASTRPLSDRHHPRHRSWHHSNDNHSSSTSRDGVESTMNPTAPTKVPPLRLHELAPPRSEPSISSPVSGILHAATNPERNSQHSYKSRHQKGKDKKTKAVQCRVQSQLVSPPSSHSSSPSSVPHSQSLSRNSSASSRRRYSAVARGCNNSPVPVLERAVVSSVSSFSGSTSPSVHQHQQPSPPLSRRSAREPLQKTVLVRRVVRRRRSEVFVEEGGSLVYRAPVALRGPSHSRASTPAASSRNPSRARNAGKMRENE